VENPSEKSSDVRLRRLRAVGSVLVACVCGWFVMELEILGVRMLTPYFGSAVYVVTGSVIGVFLLSLSVGYMAGGYVSNRDNSQRIIGVNLIIAGVWFFSLPFFVDAVCEMIFGWGLDEKWGSLLATLFLFGIPTMLLATVSPTVVRWLTRRPADAGFNTGLVLTVSTIASFAGCVVTAFYLVTLSLRLTIRVSGIVLVLLGGSVVLCGLLCGKGSCCGPVCPEEVEDEA
jgi:MFS family permease